MEKIVKRAQHKTRNVALYLRNHFPVIVMLLVMAMLLVSMFVFCNGDVARDAAFDAIFNALKTITTIIGTIFLIVGIVRFIIAHANEDGPNQQKAAMLIATGIALIVIGPALNQLIKPNDFIQTSFGN